MRASWWSASRATGDGGRVGRRAPRATTVTVLEDHPVGDALRATASRRARGAAARRCVEAPATPTWPRARSRPPTSWCRARACAPTIRRSSRRTRAGVPVRSEIDLAVERLRARPDAPRLVAVTGTNGKTTVTTLIAAMLAASGIAQRRRPATSAVRCIDAVGDDVDVVVAEVSSFQLEFTTDAFAPDVAVLLNVARTTSTGTARSTPTPRPRRACSRTRAPDDVLVVNRDDPVAARARAPARRRGSSARARGRARRRRLRRARRHARRPGRACSRRCPASRRAARRRQRARRRGGRASTWAPTSTRWRGRSPASDGLAPPRGARSASVGGVQYVDDSKATNPHATAERARRASSTSCCIAGGRNKALDLGGAAARTRAGCGRSSRSARPPARSRPRSPASVPVVARPTRCATRCAPRPRARSPATRCCCRPRARRSTGTRATRARGDDFAREVRRCSPRRPAPCRERRTAHDRVHRARVRAHRHRPRAVARRRAAPRRRGRRPRSCSSRRSRCSTSSAW